MGQKYPEVGKIIRDYRLAQDYSASRFAASCGRTTKWTYNLEATGRGYERTWSVIGKEHPELKRLIQAAIGRFPPQEYARIHDKIQAGRSKLLV